MVKRHTEWQSKCCHANVEVKADAAGDKFEFCESCGHLCETYRIDHRMSPAGPREIGELMWGRRPGKE